ncbi:MAG TPA: NAD(P)-dependent alcohol dehydrogenase [Nitrososphaerales archaeon]|nr:NAD(P)-dependent alcohol dehydrogenase [Nitrososphaerales archaeon]
MKAFRFHGSKSGARLDEVSQPKVDSDREVLLKVAGAGVCKTDLHILDGLFDRMISHVPFTLGHESVGWVEEPGQEPGHLRKGDPVIIYPQSTCGLCTACREGKDMSCERGKFYGLDGTDGGFAEYIKVSARCVVPVPKGEDLVTLAPMADAGLTAYHCVRGVVHELKTSGRVVVIGVGGVGQTAIQLLRLMTPAEIIAVDVAESRLRIAEEMGADHSVVSADDQDSLSKELLSLTQGRGAEVVMDLVGESSTAKLALEVLARGGLYSVVGYGGDVSLPTMQLVASQVRIQGNLVGTYSELVELVKIFVKRGLKVRVEKRGLDEVEDTLSDLRKGAISGRAVLVP